MASYCAQRDQKTDINGINLTDKHYVIGLGQLTIWGQVESTDFMAKTFCRAYKIGDRCLLLVTKTFGGYRKTTVGHAHTYSMFSPYRNSI